MLQKASKVNHEKQNFHQQLEARPNTSTKNRLHNLLWEARLVFFKKKRSKIQLAYCTKQYLQS